MVKASGCSAVGPSVFDQSWQKGGGGGREGLKAFQRSERDPEIQKEKARPHPASQAHPRATGAEAPAHGCLCTPALAPSPAAMGPCAPLFLLLLLSWSGPLGGQQQHLVEYMERRLVALEVSDSSPSPAWQGGTFFFWCTRCLRHRGMTRQGSVRTYRKLHLLIRFSKLKPSSPHTQSDSDLCVLPLGFDRVEGRVQTGAGTVGTQLRTSWCFCSSWKLPES